MNTSNLSADNFKKILVLDGSTPEPTIRSGDIGQRIPCFDSCQLITTNQFSPGLPRLTKWLESVRVNIGIPVVRTDDRSGVRSRDYQNFKMGRLPNFLTHGAPLRARGAQLIIIRPKS